MVAAPAVATRSRRRGIRQHLAAMQHDDPVGVRHLVAQMRRPQHRDLALGAHRQHEPDEVAAALRIEPDGGLVHEQEARLVQQRARELDPAAVAAAQLRGLVVGAIDQPEAGELALDARAGDLRAGCHAARRGTTGWR